MKPSSIPRSFHPIWVCLAMISPVFAVVTIDYATVGDPGNLADPATGGLYGAVGYEYKIAKNETTISQYTEFLNAVAAVPSGSHQTTLWNSEMGSNAYTAGITRSGSGTSGDPYTYAAIGSGNRPIAYVSWFDAARFVNWMHNGQSNGSTETGVYQLNGATSGIFTAQSGATIWLPTENEWYKAAYYDPTKNSGVGGYWQYANQSNTMTSNDVTVAGAANFYDGDYAVTQSSTVSASQNYLTDVGAYGTDSESFYGTNDQSGNLFEWNDGTFSGTMRGLRGGSWGNGGGGSSVDDLSSLSNQAHLPSFENDHLGFRVASIPEPNSAILALFAGCIWTRRKR